MTIGVIYCEALDAEIKALVADIPEANKLEPMPWGLHIDPDRLLAEVRNKILHLQDRVDVIVLGYGRCQALDRLGDNFKVPILWPAAEDCIGVLLGQQRYEEELQREPGTWFLTPGWIRMGTDFVFRELQINRIGRNDIDPLQLARRMLEGFSRALYIDMNLDLKGEDLEKKARLIATDLALRLEIVTGSCALLKEVFDHAMALSGQSSAEDK
jgi:hypothetical protein